MSGATVNETWQFRDRVDDYPPGPAMLSEVLYRCRTSKGLEIYGVLRLEECEVPYLMMLGEVRVAA